MSFLCFTQTDKILMPVVCDELCMYNILSRVQLLLDDDPVINDISALFSTEALAPDPRK